MSALGGVASRPCHDLAEFLELEPDQIATAIYPEVERRWARVGQISESNASRRGQYDLAIFVEDRFAMAPLPSPASGGVELMKNAFQRNGPLAPPKLASGERVAPDALVCWHLRCPSESWWSSTRRLHGSTGGR